jgi:hypothetical protein
VKRVLQIRFRVTIATWREIDKNRTWKARGAVEE